MTKPELGTKRLCAGCNAKFYDLMKDPIVCPSCEAVFVEPKAEPARQKRNYNLRSATKPEAVAEEPIAAKAEGEEPEVEDDDKDSEGGVALLEDDEDE